MMIKTIIFDLGKVIVPFDIERLNRLESYCDLPPSKIREAFLAVPELRLYETGAISSMDFYTGVKDSLQLEIEFPEFAVIWNGIFDLEPLIGESLIESLKSEFRLLVLSDTNKMHFDFISQNFPLLRHFDEYCLSYETGFMKPTAESFAAALEKADCMAEECFFIDDKLANVLGAQDFGMRSTQFIGEAELSDNLIELRKESF